MTTSNAIVVILNLFLDVRKMYSVTKKATHFELHILSLWFLCGPQRQYFIKARMKLFSDKSLDAEVVW